MVPEPTFITITDGSSNTVGVVECGPPVPWTKPADLKVANLSTRLPALAWPFNNAMQFSMMDGSTRLFARTLPEKTLRELMTGAGGEVLTDEMLAHPVRLPATTAEEKALLAKSLAENQRLVAEIGKAALEHGRLLGERARATGDLFEAEGTTEQLKQMLEDIRLKNTQLAAPPAVAAPKK